MSHDNLAARISEKAEIRIEDMTLGSKSGSAPPILLTEPVIDPTRGRHRLEDESLLFSISSGILCCGICRALASASRMAKS
jgi:hypothetical protein